MKTYYKNTTNPLATKWIYRRMTHFERLGIDSGTAYIMARDEYVELREHDSDVAFEDEEQE